MKSAKTKDKVINTIRYISAAHPELRLGQLIMNVIPVDLDLYYISDKDLIEYLKAYNPLKPLEVS